MKTTLNIDDTLLEKAKAAAAQERTSLSRLIEEGLTLRLRVPKIKRRRDRVQLPVFDGKSGLSAGIDPTSNKSLIDAADA